MADWKQHADKVRAFVARIPLFGWLGLAAFAMALSVAIYLESSGPPYVALFDGLAPADGGKIIAQLQTLGIPYQLQAAGNVILVPAGSLAAARLQLGALHLPGNSAATAWDKLESAPMTTTEAAQNAMATQALQASLQQSIESFSGVRSAEVYIAVPADTPFVADQPDVSASVIIDADEADAEGVAGAVAHLVAGAVPGLKAERVTISTTAGIRVFPSNTSQASKQTEFATIDQIESLASAQVSRLLAPIVGDGRFRVAVSADVDFTQTTTHQIAYGPAQMVSRSERSQTVQTALNSNGFGIPGALSNEPPSATTASAPTTPQATNGAAPSANGTAGQASTAQAAPTPPEPQKSINSSTQTYVTDQSDSDITKPDWVVNGLSVSVVLDKVALRSVDLAQIKQAVAAAFSYPNIAVNVISAPFVNLPAPGPPFLVQQAIGPLSHAVLEVLGAIALLFGLALPMGRRIGTLATIRRPLALTALPAGMAAPPEASAVPPPPSLPPRVEYTALREEAAKNIPAVARLLQNWVEDSE